MGCEQDLRNLLAPLGVYRLQPGSYSGGELAALGAALDTMEAELDRILREAFPETAEDMGLLAWEAILPGISPLRTPGPRRTAIRANLCVTDNGFTPEAIVRGLAACGLVCQVTERADRMLEVSLPDLRGRPPQLEKLEALVRSVLPCHLDMVWVFCYCPWQEISHLTWGDLKTRTWLEWMNLGQQLPQ